MPTAFDLVSAALSKLPSAYSQLPTPAGVPPITGESGEAVLHRLPQHHIDRLYNAEKFRWKYYKAISVYKILPEITLPGDFAQFGVFEGFTARLIAMQMNDTRPFHLFDSFEGLPEAWAGQWDKGAFDLKGKPPALDFDNMVIHKGWFSDTVAPWVETLTQPLAFLHLDADLYSSTIDVLFAANKVIVPGTILLFDEYIMNGQDDEHRALLDWAEKYDRQFEYLWRTRWMQVAVRVTG